MSEEERATQGVFVPLPFGPRLGVFGVIWKSNRDFFLEHLFTEALISLIDLV